MTAQDTTGNTANHLRIPLHNEQSSNPNGSTTHLYTGEVAYDGQSNLQKFTEKVGTAKTA